MSNALCVVLLSAIPLCTIVATTLFTHLVCKRGATKESIRTTEVTDAAHLGSHDPDRRCRLSSGCEMTRVMTEEILKLGQALLVTAFITTCIKFLGGRCAEHAVLERAGGSLSSHTATGRDPFFTRSVPTPTTHARASLLVPLGRCMHSWECMDA